VALVYASVVRDPECTEERKEADVPRGGSRALHVIAIVTLLRFSITSSVPRKKKTKKKEGRPNAHAAEAPPNEWISEETRERASRPSRLTSYADYASPPRFQYGRRLASPARVRLHDALSLFLSLLLSHDKNFV